MKKLQSQLAFLFTAASLIFYTGGSKSNAQIITTVAGNGSGNYCCDGGPATAAELQQPSEVAFDASGNMYIADYDNDRIRKVNTSGTISTFAGNGVQGFSGDNSQASAAELYLPHGVAVDASGNVYIADLSNQRIRKVNTSGIISTFAGNGIAGYSGNTLQATTAELDDPSGVAVDASGNVYIADGSNQLVRKVNTSGIISTFAGSFGVTGISANGRPATASDLFNPTGVAVDNDNNVYISNDGSNIVSIVNSSGIMNTFAGNGIAGYTGDGGPATAAELNEPYNVAIDASGNVYIADYNNSRVRIVSPSGNINTVAGNGSEGYSGDGNPASAAELNLPSGVAVNSHGELFIADQQNNVIREVTSPGGGTPPCNGWLQEASLTTARENAFHFSIGHYGYVGCGNNSSGNLDDVWRWNQNTNTWTQVASYPGSGRTACAAFSIGGNGYVGMGGVSGSFPVDFWQYDTTTNAWTQIANYPGNKGQGSFAFVLGTNAYVGGGDPGGTPYSDEMYQYNSLTNTWTAEANYAGGDIAGCAYFALNGYGYVGCGSNGSSLTNTMYKYNPTSNTWTGIAAFPISGSQVANPSSFAIDTLGYVGAGENLSGVPYRVFWSYSATKNTWTPIASIQGVARAAGIGFSIGNLGYAGMGDSVSTYLSDFYQYGVCASILSVSTNVIGNVSCFGGSTGSVSASPSGGVSPYTYSWTPAGGSNSLATGLSAGTYTITAKDNAGSTATSTATITQPLVALSIGMPTISNVNCTGGNGSATASLVSGGTSPYTYSWSGGGGSNSTATISAGTYTLTVTDNHSCSASASVTITQPITALGISITSVTSVNCNVSGTATASTPTGGTSPYTYSWSGGAGSNLTATSLSAGTYTITATDNHDCTATAAATITQTPSSLAISIASSTNISCFGGTGTITANSASGGTSPYFYTWSGGGGTSLIATVSAGIYTITVIDNHGCSTTATASLTQPVSAVSITIASLNNISCYGGNASVTANAATGGTSPFSYLWTPSGGTNIFASLSAGTYTLTATDSHNCSATVSAVITQPASALTISVASVNNVSCSITGSATANSASGGTSPYTYSWNIGTTNLTATNLSAGTYTITVHDNHGCSATASATVTQTVSNIGISLASISNVNCAGGAGSITANSATGGNLPYTYSWSGTGGSNLFATLSAGTYTITVTDNHGCTANASATLTQPGALGIVIGTVNNPVCGNLGSITANAATGGTPPFTYSWSGGAGNNLTATGLSAGTYTITVTDNHNCSASASASITQAVSTLGIAIASVTNGNCNSGTGSATANAATGGTSPYTYSWSGGAGNSLTATGLSAGTYTISATDNGGCIATASVTITQSASALGITIASVTNESCNVVCGITANTATGGTSPYTYLWTPYGGTGLTTVYAFAGTYTITVTDRNGCTASATASITQTATNLLTTPVIMDNVSCYGSSDGLAKVGTSGGTTPYSYYWSPNTSSTYIANGLSAGTYTVVVVDKNGCNSNTASLTITQPTAIRDSMVSVTNESCHGAGGSASFGVKGGSLPYTYIWNPNVSSSANATGLNAGNYVVEVKDGHGCVGAAVYFSITQPVAVRDSIVTSSIVNVKCSGSSSGSATVGIKYGSTPFTYSWSPSGGNAATATGLSAGTYTVSVTDGCSNVATASVVITQSASSLGISIASQTNIGCGGGSTGSATANAATGGNPPYTYSWSGGGNNLTASNLSAGTYTITTTDNIGCSAIATVTITSTASLSVSISALDNVTCNGNTNGSAGVTPSGGTSPYTYSWNIGGNTNASVTGLSAGSYTIIVRDFCGNSASASVVITQPSSVLGVTIGTVSNVPCYGGTGYITANAATGGTAPYSYVWYASGGTNLVTTGLSAGTYTLFVVDYNGCFAQATAVISQPSVLTASASSILGSCVGGASGSASASQTGGTSPYSYQWNDHNNQTTITATGLSSGSYNVTVTDSHGCSASASVSITQAASSLGITIASTSNVNCNTLGTATANSATGGSSPYTYSWSGGGGSNITATGLSAGVYTITASDRSGCSATASASITQSASTLNITIASVINESCNIVSSITANLPTGGTSPYTYLWSPLGGTSLTTVNAFAGTYTITVSDKNGCSATASATITQAPSSVTVNAVITSNVSCNGGSDGLAKAAGAGGTSPYTYYWFPTGGTSYIANNLTAGTYTVEVADNNGCNSGRTTVTISQPTAIRDSMVTVTNASCFGGGGSATFGIKGGSLPYTYVWNPNVSTTATATGLTARIYIVEVKDGHGCTSPAVTFSITQPVIVRDSIIKTSVVNELCNGSSSGSAKVGAKYGTLPYTYSWNPNGGNTATGTNLSAGTYTVTVTDGCGNAIPASVVITQPAAFRDSISSITCNSNIIRATVGVKGGSSPYTYFWSPNVNSTATASGLSAGTYTIYIVDRNGCSTSLAANLSCTGSPVKEGLDNASNTSCCLDGMQNVNLYPNPNTGQFTIDGVVAGMIIEVYDYTGQRINLVSVTDTKMLLNISNQANGVYLVRILSKDGILVSQKKVVKVQ